MTSLKHGMYFLMLQMKGVLRGYKPAGNITKEIENDNSGKTDYRFYQSFY